MIRTVLEKLSRRLVFRRRLDGAPIYVSGAGGLRYLFRPMKQIDPALCGLARDFVKPGHVVWDVGANLGLFSVAAAGHAARTGKVFAIEPDTWLVGLLRRSAAEQPVRSAPIEVIPAAVGEACALRTFHIARRARAANFLAGYGSAQAGGIAEKQTVMAVNLDWLTGKIPPPDVVKIDVEGAEREVLSGARGLLQTARPVILCEVAAENSAQVAEFLGNYGYAIFDGDTPDRSPAPSAPWNTVAIPAERVKQWAGRERIPDLE